MANLRTVTDIQVGLPHCHALMLCRCHCSPAPANLLIATPFQYLVCNRLGVTFYVIWLNTRACGVAGVSCDSPWPEETAADAWWGGNGIGRAV